MRIIFGLMECLATFHDQVKLVFGLLNKTAGACSNVYHSNAFKTRASSASVPWSNVQGLLMQILTVIVEAGLFWHFYNFAMVLITVYNVKCCTPGCPLVATNYPTYVHCCKSCCRADQKNASHAVHNQDCCVKVWDPNEREVSYEWVEFSSDSSVDELDSDESFEDMCAVISDDFHSYMDELEDKFEVISDGGDWTVSSMNELEPQPEDMFEVIPDDGDSQDGSPLTSSLSRPAEAGSNPWRLALLACLESILQPSDNSKASVDLLAYDCVRCILGGGFRMCAAEYYHAFGPITSDAPFGMHVFTGLFDKLRREYCLFARHGWYFQQALQNAGHQHVRAGWFLKPEPFTMQRARLSRSHDTGNVRTWYPAMFIVDVDLVDANDEAHIVTAKSLQLVKMACLAIVLMRSHTWLVHPDRIQLLSETNQRAIFQHN